MENFNLNIDNYTNQELEELLSLSGTYNSDGLLLAKESLKSKLLKHDGLDVNKKQEIMMFIDNIHVRLLNHISQKNATLNGTYNDTQNNVEQVGTHFLIKNNNSVEGKNAKIWNGRDVDTNEYPPGYLNPINIKTIKHSINIDTKFRPDYFLTKSSDFTVTLPDRVNKVVSMRLSSINIPMSFYAISKSLGNNTFSIDVSGSGPVNVVIPDGNYECRFSRKTGAAFIEDAVNDAMEKAGIDLGRLVYSVDIVSGRSVFAAPSSASGPTSFTICFNVDEKGEVDNTTPILFRFGWQLGFRVASYTGESAISEGVCYVNGPEYVYISVNDYNNSSNNFFRAAFSESILSPHILGRLNITSALQSRGIYKSGQDDNYNDSLSRTREYFGPVDIQRLTITLYDEFGRVLDLNNMDWSFVLSFVCLYD